MRTLKKQKTNIISLFILIIFVSFFIAPYVSATKSIYDQASQGFQDTIKSAYGDEADPTINPSEGKDPFSKPLIIIINQVLTFIGVIFLFLLLYAGYLWMNARGKEEEIDKAKKIVQEAVIGLIIILLARLITEFILLQVGQAIYAT